MSKTLPPAVRRYGRKREHVDRWDTRSWEVFEVDVEEIQKVELASVELQTNVIHMLVVPAERIDACGSETLEQR